MGSLPQPFSYQRLNGVPLDETEKFANMTAFLEYLTSPLPYSGQRCIVDNNPNEPFVYRVTGKSGSFSYAPESVGNSIDGGKLTNLILENGG